jgi:fructose-bisphosphate aldolase class II
MIDASQWPLHQNIALTTAVVDYAHARDVSVEGELGRVRSTCIFERDGGETVLTDPDEAGRFVAATGIDALAVSVGTALGPYGHRQPHIDYDLLCAIRRCTAVPLVLHGGSGVPPDMLARAIRIPGGGVSQVNLATDLELALLEAVGREAPMSNAECQALPDDRRDAAQIAVQRVVMDKMCRALLSEGQARALDLVGRP